MFEKCSPVNYEGVCKSEEEINEWLARKFIIILMNQERFSVREYEESKKVALESRLVYSAVNSQQREESVYKVQLTKLQLQD